MPPGKALFDDVAYERSDAGWAKREKKFRSVGACQDLKALTEIRLGRRCRLSKELMQGSYNVIYKLHVEGPKEGDPEDDIILRVPCSGIIQFPDEKTLME